MKSNIILLIIGIVILTISFIIAFMLKEKKQYSKAKYHKKQKENNVKVKDDYKFENQIILERLKTLEQEIVQLKEENIILAKKYRKDNVLLKENTIENNNFKPILNYNVFKEKNSAIIELYEKGKSKEEIAKSLNKSIREIEMVIRLVE